MNVPKKVRIPRLSRLGIAVVVVTVACASSSGHLFASRIDLTSAPQPYATSQPLVEITPAASSGVAPTPDSAQVHAPSIPSDTATGQDPASGAIIDPPEPGTSGVEASPVQEQEPGGSESGPDPSVDQPTAGHPLTAEPEPAVSPTAPGKPVETVTATDWVECVAALEPSGQERFECLPGLILREITRSGDEARSFVLSTDNPAYAGTVITVGLVSDGAEPVAIETIPIEDAGEYAGATWTTRDPLLQRWTLSML